MTSLSSWIALFIKLSALRQFWLDLAVTQGSKAICSKTLHTKCMPSRSIAID